LAKILTKTSVTCGFSNISNILPIMHTQGGIMNNCRERYVVKFKRTISCLEDSVTCKVNSHTSFPSSCSFATLYADNNQHIPSPSPIPILILSLPLHFQPQEKITTPSNANQPANHATQKLTGHASIHGTRAIFQKIDPLYSTKVRMDKGCRRGKSTSVSRLELGGGLNGPGLLNIKNEVDVA
jgi:hypothetical protein